ncbi:ParA family protein [Leptothermofonsia sp. ETS-13]|uniref:ParA family protein n=1 Tax=Leptothermofonsia sp. ETS-13 TaxID=3035696 RepID=UPI003BA05877
MITNSIHIQLFRKHCKVIHPATRCLEINSENIDLIIRDIKQQIEQPLRALTIAVYNNKGGVGKTTTIANLASVLKLAGHKEVLVIDLDPNQQDLTNSLGLSLSDGEFKELLTEKYSDIQPCIQKFSIIHKNREINFFDVIPADSKLVEGDEAELRQQFKRDILRQKLNSVKPKYDYIIIDSPPNWGVFSQLAVIAADVVLIPTKHNNIFSLENAALAIKKFIPEAQKIREDGCPVPLPIFFNDEKVTESQKAVAYQAIDNILR